jgi:hypothetical protein
MQVNQPNVEAVLVRTESMLVSMQVCNTSLAASTAIFLQQLNGEQQAGLTERRSIEKSSCAPAAPPLQLGSNRMC